MTIGLRQPRVSRERIFADDLAQQRVRKPVRQHAIAVELPMRIIRREQKQLVGLKMLDQPQDRFRLVGASIG